MNLKQRIRQLEEGSCRSHCRTRRQAFRAGYLAALDHVQDELGCEEIVFPLEEYGGIIERSFKKWRGDVSEN